MTAMVRYLPGAPGKGRFMAGAFAVLMMTLGTQADAETDGRSAGSNWLSKQQQGQLVQTSGKKTLNLLTVAPKPRKPRVVRAVIGRGSYICSPSGFGQRSRCSRN